MAPYLARAVVTSGHAPRTAGGGRRPVLLAIPGSWPSPSRRPLLRFRRCATPASTPSPCSAAASAEQVSARDHRLRRRLLRLRQRRLARPLLRQRDALDGFPQGRGADKPPLPQQPRRDVHGRDPEGRARAHRLGAGRPASATTTTTASTISSSPTTARTACIKTTARARLRTLRPRPGSRTRGPDGAPARLPRLRPGRRLDLFVANYIDLDLETAPTPESGPCLYKGVMVACGPPGLPGARISSTATWGDGTFTDVSEKAGILKTMAPTASGSSRPISTTTAGPTFTSPMTRPRALYHNNKDGTFTDIARRGGRGLQQDGKPQAGMGVGDRRLRRHGPHGHLQDQLLRRHLDALPNRATGLLSTT